MAVMLPQIADGAMVAFVIFVNDNKFESPFAIGQW